MPRLAIIVLRRRRGRRNPEPQMPIIAQVLDYRDELIAIRRDIHAHPELAFAEQRTSDLVAGKLAESDFGTFWMRAPGSATAYRRRPDPRERNARPSSIWST